MKKNTITAERLRQALDKAHMTQQQLSDRSGVAKASISQYINGYYIPSNESAGKMAKVLNVSPVWLMGFDVPMSAPEVLYDLAVETTSGNLIIEKYERLNETGQAEALILLDYLLSQDRYKK